METLAEKERLVQQNTEQNEQNENRIKLNKFRENPKVDIAKSRLADELKIILDEAQKRIQDKDFPNTKLNKITKRGKKKQKEVTFSNKKSIMNKNVGKFYDVTEDDNIKEALMKVEQKIVDNPEQDLDDDVNDSSLLNGFMEGFEEEEKEEEGLKQADGRENKMRIKEKFMEFMERQILDFEEELECPVCLEVATVAPIYKCPDDHLLCRICRPKLSECPQCRVPLDPVL